MKILDFKRVLTMFVSTQVFINFSPKYGGAYDSYDYLHYVRLSHNFETIQSVITYA